MMWRVPRRVAAVIVAAPIALAGTGCSLGMQNYSFDAVQGRETYPLEVELSTADLLMVGSEVRMGQRLLGRVSDLSTEVRPDDGRRIAIATVSLDSSVELPRNSTVTVELPNTLGNPYLRVRVPDQPEGGVFEAGERVPESQTDRGPDLENALASLSLVLSEGGVGSLEVIADEMEAAVGNRSEDIRRLVSSLNDVVAVLSTHSADIDGILASVSSASEQLVAERESFERGLDRALPVFDLLIEQWDEIANLMSSTGSMSTDLNTILTESEADLQALPADLAAFLEQLNDADTIAALESVSALFDGVSKVQRGDYLAADINVDLPAALSELFFGNAPRPQTGGGR
jgi:phospholipid/cholesterol/gamma-HCH transport system substrate-binding protein